MMSEPWITGPVWPKKGYHRPDWGLPLLFLRFKEWRWKLRHKGALPHRHCSCAYSTDSYTTPPLNGRVAGCCACRARDSQLHPLGVQQDARK